MTALLPTVALVQMEVLPGRPDLNVERMLAFVDQAREGKAEVVVFSEMCIPGYIVGDLWEVNAVVNDFAAYSEMMCEHSQGITVLFGNVAVDENRIGEDGRPRKFNSVFVCSDGRYLDRPGLPDGLPPGTHAKSLHPNYRFFDDDRHFYSLRKLAQSRGRSPYDWVVPFEIPLRAGGLFRFGVQLCEDIWCEDYSLEQDTLDTLRTYHERGADAVFNLSASPWTWQKNEKRNRVVRDILARSPLPLYYVNQVGAQNNGKNVIVFDGDTTAYAANGAVAMRAEPWKEQVLFSPTFAPGGAKTATVVPPLQAEVAAEYSAIGAGLRHLDYILGGDRRYLIGASGGIDSSVVLCMLVQTFGPERVFAVNMPTRFNSSITQRNAQQLCESLGVSYISCGIQDLYGAVAAKIKDAEFAHEAGDYTPLVDENIQARIRGADILAGLAAKLGLVFTSNGNKTETALGYATLYGDVNGAIAPIGDLYKVQVIRLARHLNDEIFAREVVPDNLISGATVPSAELSAEQDVTKGLGDPIKYGYHDAVLRQMIEYRHHLVDFFLWYIGGELFERLEWDDTAAFDGYFPSVAAWVEDLEWVDRQLRINYFKRVQAPPTIVLSKRAFGFDLRESQLPNYRLRGYASLRERVLQQVR